MTAPHDAPPSAVLEDVGAAHASATLLERLADTLGARASVSFAVRFFPRTLVDALADDWETGRGPRLRGGRPAPPPVARHPERPPVTAPMIPAPGITVDGTGLLCVQFLLLMRGRIEGAPAGTVKRAV